MKKLSIIGCGLAGSLFGIYLAKRGYELEMYEARSDLRLSPKDSGRSINLALSCRGLTGLTAAGLLPEVEKLRVPMRARAIHDEDGSIKYQPFGRHPEEYISAIVRNELNILLLNRLQTFPGVSLQFNMKLVDIDVTNKTIQFESEGSLVSKPYQRIIAADGAGSLVREALSQRQLVQANRRFLSHGYKELSLSGPATEAYAREHLHLWPRDSFLLLGNPNRDDSITGSLFLAKEGKNSFHELSNELQISNFFKHSFPDAFAAMPNLMDEFLNHPTGSMSTINCVPWHYEDQCLLIGDAAHGVVPFFGQGMNAAFEDCRLLDLLLTQYQDDWSQVMPHFSKTRKADTDAVAAMSLDNFREIQTDIRSPHFNFKKQLEQVLMQRYPEHYVSKHVLVMFTNTPYKEAFAHGVLQNHLLEHICSLSTDFETMPWSEVDELMLKYDKNLTLLKAELKGDQE